MFHRAMAELTILDLGSDPRERGSLHGRRMRRQIRDNYATYLTRLEDCQMPVGASIRAANPPAL